MTDGLANTVVLESGRDFTDRPVYRWRCEPCDQVGDWTERKWARHGARMHEKGKLHRDWLDI